MNKSEKITVLQCARGLIERGWVQHRARILDPLNDTPAAYCLTAAIHFCIHQEGDDFGSILNEAIFPITNEIFKTLDLNSILSLRDYHGSTDDERRAWALVSWNDHKLRTQAEVLSLLDRTLLELLQTS